MISEFIFTSLSIAAHFGREWVASISGLLVFAFFPFATPIGCRQVTFLRLIQLSETWNGVKLRTTNFVYTNVLISAQGDNATISGDDLCYLKGSNVKHACGMTVDIVR